MKQVKKAVAEIVRKRVTEYGDEFNEYLIELCQRVADDTVTLMRSQPQWRQPYRCTCPFGGTGCDEQHAS